MPVGSSVPQQHCGLKRTQNVKNKNNEVENISDVYERWNCWLVWVQNR
jgi:hypothetical protein